MKVQVVSADACKRVIGIAVIVDVFRSSSAIVTALANGARCVIPYTNIADAVRFRRRRKREDLILAGERHGITPALFDYNISPIDMTRKNIGRKTILFTSTNLTRIFAKFGQSGTIIGSIINARAAASYLGKLSRDVTIISCGTREGPAIEDLAGAGAIASFLMKANLSDEALAAVGLYKGSTWRNLVMKGRTAKRIRDLGLGRDIDFCLSPNLFPVVPILRGRRIVIAEK